ncbi:hypothetical protein [Pseudotabrizicola sp. L79]|uniref:hypothetical protein n=1 Tax=Pseudotabrizicola sp. L79 TaxID=3118402 RepID=UPI002F91D5CF
MGNFVSKPAFDLTAFLAQKASPSQTRFRGRAAYKPRVAESVTPEDQSALGAEDRGQNASGNAKSE